MKLRVLAAALTLAAGTSHAANLISAGDSWQYTFSTPAAGWQVGTDGGAWSTGNAPFSNCGAIGGNDCSGYDSFGYFNANTQWNASPTWGDDLWVRKQIDLSGFDLNSVAWNLGVDNGYTLFINGTLVAAGNAEGFTYRWEYGGSVPAGLLNAGNNWVAVALEDHGGLTAFDMQLSATAAPVPEPGTYATLLAGLGIMLMLGKRRAR